MKTIETDVVVVGGGPAGLSVAQVVAQGGQRVTLVEKSNEIGYPIHTSGGSFVDDLKALGIPEALYHPIYRCRFLSPNNKVVKEYKGAVACVLDVRGLYQYLAEKAIEAGTQVLLKFTAKAAIVEDDYVVGVTGRDFRSRDWEIRARVVVDASGFSSIISRKAGVHEAYQRFGIGAEYDLYAPNIDEDEAVLLVGNLVAPAGYAWIFPWGNHRARVGVGMIRPDDKGNPGDYLDRLISASAELGLGLEEAQPIEYHHGVVPSQGVREEFVANGLVAVGDAVGQASALAGEGIRYAMIAGRMAGKVILEALESDDVSKSYLKRYEKEWKKKYGRNFAIAHEVNKRISKWTDEKWDSRLNILGDLTSEQFAQAMQSDFSPSWALKVLASNPSLVSEGTKKLVGLLKGKG